MAFGDAVKKTKTNRVSTNNLGNLGFGEQPEVAGPCKLTVEMHYKAFLQPG